VKGSILDFKYLPEKKENENIVKIVVNSAQTDLKVSYGNSGIAEAIFEKLSDPNP